MPFMEQTILGPLVGVRRTAVSGFIRQMHQNFFGWSGVTAKETPGLSFNISRQPAFALARRLR
jgi:hypothetical protein